MEVVMQHLLLLAVSIHVLSAVFWAGSTFTIARTGAPAIAKIFRPQVGSATVAIASGGYLWHALHAPGIDSADYVLGAGAACGILAFITQVLFTAPSLIRDGGQDRAEPRHRVLVAQRCAAALLAVTVICMAAARFT